MGLEEAKKMPNPYSTCPSTFVPPDRQFEWRIRRSVVTREKGGRQSYLMLLCICPHISRAFTVQVCDVMAFWKRFGGVETPSASGRSSGHLQ